LIDEGVEMTSADKPTPTPIFLPGGKTGILLVHGFTGSPPEMSLIAEYLHGKNLTVSAPLLPGHGTTPQELNRTHWEDWVNHAEAALAEIRSKCDPVFIGGLSLGSLIALQLAEVDHEIPGIIVYSPAVMLRSRGGILVPIIDHFVRLLPKSKLQKDDLFDSRAKDRIWDYDQVPLVALGQLLEFGRKVRRNLGEVNCPMLVVYSTQDMSIHERSAQTVFDKIRSTQKKMVTLHKSGHVVTLDQEWLEVAEQTYRFIQENTR
jgi:carboxylesterase